MLLAGLAAPARADVPPPSKASIPAAPAAAVAAASQGTPAQIGAIPDPNPGLSAPLTNYTTRNACDAAAPGIASCLAQIVTPVGAAPQASLTLPSGYGPGDLKSAYNIDTTLGAGNTVAIIDAYNDPNAAANLATYRSTYGLPACTVANGCFRQLNQTGATSPLPANNASWAVEISLDIDMVSAICPLCHIDLVEANSSSIANLAAAANMAAGLPGVKAISNSYGSGEFSSETSFDASYSHAGITTTASSGDSGYGVSYPAADPNLTAVGGTSLVLNSSVPRGWSETAWSGAGSGCSVYEAKPAWQHDPTCSKRTVADVSSVASPSTPVAIYDTYNSGGWGLVGGTSVSSPIVASMAALANADFRASGNASSFYEMAPGYVGVNEAGFGINDVTAGSNGSCSSSYLCTAGVGFDGPTGTGSVETAPRSSIGYVWANSPTSAGYTPSSLYSYNAYGATNTITRSGVGTYRVTFPRLASGGTVDVTAYSTNVHCNTSGWSHAGSGFGSTESVGVSCYSSSGAPADSYYDVSFVNPAGQVGSANFADDSLGFVWANSPTSPSYTPSTFYQYNNFNQNNTITRSSVGVYTVNFAELAPVPTTDQGTVKVTAYATNDNCVSGGWSGSSANSYNEAVTVRCFTPAGAPADAQFTVSYAADLALTGAPGSRNAYLWASSPSSTVAYNALATWSFNSAGGVNTVQRTSTGTYTVTLPGLTTVGGDVQVTAYGSAATSCRTNGWGSGATGTTVSVACVNSAGAPIDAYFNLQYFS